MLRRLRLPLLAWSLVVATASVSLAEQPATATKPKTPGKTERLVDDETYELYKIFAETMFQVEQNYVKDIKRRELMEAAIRGVLEKLDPYSNYISPEEISRFKTSVESQFGGIGIQVTVDGGQLKVLSPLVGSPAYRAGIQAGDAIVEINGKSAQGITIDEAVKQLKGEPGTPVSVTVLHEGSRQRQTMSLNREIIHVETVMGDRRKNDDSWDFMYDAEKKIGMIRITAFSRDTAEQVEQAVKQLKQQNLQGLVIDLRFNPGGLLKSATDIADLFLTDGVIVTTRGRNTAPREVQARKAGTFEGFPIAILVNRFSASASEIVSAALQDHHRAVVIGERTWGKGSVQNVIDLEEGKSALKLTTASYWRPSGKNIHRFPDSKETDEWGVMPDKGFELKLSDAELGELVRVRRERDMLLVSHAPAAVNARQKADEVKKTDAKPKDEKPSDDKESKKNDASKDKKDDKKAEPAKNDKAKAEPAKDNKPFVDRQLQKALDYLTTELAKAQ
jgi:carboxyl-terminal processing protease